MEQQKSKGAKSITNLLSKTAGLVFFSFLAISLGVVFGLLFEGWVKDQPGTPVGTDNSFQTVDLSDENTNTTSENVQIIDDTATKMPNDTLSTKKPADLGSTKKPLENATVKPIAEIKYKVRVGPYSNHNEALAASQQLHSLGYPVYVGNKPPFAVQVGAFATQSNADRLKNELISQGYKVTIEKN